MFPSYWFSCCTWPSVDSSVRSFSLSVLPNEDRVPRIHMMEERRMAKLCRHLSHPMTMEYGLSCFCDSMSCFCDSMLVRRLYNVEASQPIQPVVVSTRGVNTPCSTFWTLWLYSLFWRIRVACREQLDL